MRRPQSPGAPCRGCGPSSGSRRSGTSAPQSTAGVAGGACWAMTGIAAREEASAAITARWSCFFFMILISLSGCCHAARWEPTSCCRCPPAGGPWSPETSLAAWRRTPPSRAMPSSLVVLAAAATIGMADHRDHRLATLGRHRIDVRGNLVEQGPELRLDGRLVGIEQEGAQHRHATSVARLRMYGSSTSVHKVILSAVASDGSSLASSSFCTARARS